MRRAIAVVLAAALVGAAFVVPADAAKRRTRKQELRYENPMIGAAGTGACFGCPSFSSGPKDKYLMAEVVDDASPIGYVDISYDSDGDGISDTGWTVCGALEEAVEIPPSTEFVIFPSAAPSHQCVGASSSGTVKLTFSNLP